MEGGDGHSGRCGAWGVRRQAGWRRGGDGILTQALCEHQSFGATLPAAACLATPRRRAQITRIADAQALWEDIQKKQKGGFKAETEEEYEDSDGNVYNKRTYLDLKKQGLL